MFSFGAETNGSGALSQSQRRKGRVWTEGNASTYLTGFVVNCLEAASAVNKHRSKASTGLLPNTATVFRLCVFLSKET